MDLVFNIGESKGADGLFDQAESRAFPDDCDDGKGLDFLRLSIIMTLGSVNSTLTQVQFNLALTGIDDGDILKLPYHSHSLRIIGAAL